MKTTWVKLSDVCETTSGGTPLRSVADYYGGDIPWVKSGELRDGLIADTEEKITKAGLAGSSAKLFPAGTLLIALYGATVGRLGILGIDATTNQAVCGITPNEQLDRDFLFYYLLKQREKLIDSRTGGAQPNISQEIIRELDIPLPTLTEQKRIASLLARADRLRHLRRTAHDLGESLLQSVFLEMFGDPLANAMGWKIEKLSKTFAIKPQIGTPDPAHAGGKYLVVRVGEIGRKKVDLENSQRITLEGKELERFRLQESNEVIAYDSHVMRLRFDSKIMLPVFFWHWLKSDGGRSRFMQKAGRTAVQFNVNTEQIAEIDIPLPPLSLQEEFAGVAARVESLRGRMSEAERQFENLFESLLSESFGG